MRRAGCHLAATIALFSAIGSWCGVVRAADVQGKNLEEVTSVGQAAIFSGDKVAARDKAIDDALRKAVERAVGTMVSSQTVTENFQLLSDRIYSQSKGYVTSYEIVSEGSEDGVFQVKVKAKVGVGNLKNDLDGILQVLMAKNMPRVLVMVTEQQVGQKTPEYWWGEKSFKTTMNVVENALISQWGSKGVKFVDRQALQGKLSTGFASSANPGDAAVKELAGKSGAEVVVRGDAIAQDQGAVMGTQMHSLQASVSLRALNLDTGSIMATATIAIAKLHINPTVGGTLALEMAGEKAAEELFDKMAAQWQAEASGSTTISVRFSGVQRLRVLTKLESFLRTEIRGVTDVRQRSFKKKVAEMEVDIEGSAQDLATELEEKKLPGITIEVEEITANSVAATLK